MKKIINGRKYDTETAKFLGNASFEVPGNFYFWSEDLYKKKTGEYFLAGEGGASSKYAHSVGLNEWSGGEDIKPLTESEAKEWVEEYLTAEDYEEIFGEVEE
jgi:hypothetical protein